MNKTIKTLTLLAAFGLSIVGASAQQPPPLKIAVVNLAQVYDEHYKTLEQNKKLESDQKKAQEELQRLNDEGNALVAEFNEKKQQAQNPALTDDARKQAEADAQAKIEEIQKKQKEVQQFQENTRRSLQQRIQTFRGVMLEEISKIAIDIAKKKGFTLVLDKSGPSLIGVAPVIYFDPSYDITDDVKAVIEKSRPADAPKPDASAAAGPASSSSAAPADSTKSDSLSVPGLKP